MDIAQLIAEISRRASIDKEEVPLHFTNVRDSAISTKDLLTQDGEDRSSTGADIAFITALADPEGKDTCEALSKDWTPIIREGVEYNRASVRFGGILTSVVVASQSDMGMVPAAILTYKTIDIWRPKLVVMTGVCAGLKGKGIELGDVLVAKDVFDYGSGKIVDGKLYPDYRPIRLDSKLTNLLIAFSMRRKVFSGIRNRFRKVGQKRPPKRPRVNVTAIGSGAAIIADERLVNDIAEKKKSLYGIDMEAYGFASAAATGGSDTRFIIAKGVQDFADRHKNDAYRSFASFVSAQFMKEFLDHYWPEIM